MRITENFRHPTQDEPTRVSVALGADNTISVDHSKANLVICAEDIGTLIGMLEALQRRAAK